MTKRILKAALFVLAFVTVTTTTLAQESITRPRTVSPAKAEKHSKVRRIGFNLGRNIYVVELADLDADQVVDPQYGMCLIFIDGDTFNLNCPGKSKPPIETKGSIHAICRCLDTEFAVEWNDEQYAASTFGVGPDVVAVAEDRAEIRDIGDLRLVIYPEAAKAMQEHGFRIEGTKLLLKKTEPINLAGPKAENKRVAIDLTDHKGSLELRVSEKSGTTFQYRLDFETETLK